MLAILLAILLVAVTVACFLANGKDAFCPSFLFCLGFAVCSLFVIANISYWGYDMSTYAFLTIVYGVLCFSMPCILIFQLWKRCSLNNISSSPERASSLEKVPIRPVLLLIFACFQLILIVATLIWIKDAYPAASLSESINRFNSQIVFSATPTTMPRALGLSRSACGGIVLFIVYLTAQELVLKRWKNVLLCGLNVVLYCLMTLESGGRTGAIVTILSLGIAFLIIKRLHLPGERLFSRKMIIVCAGMIICGVVLFPLTAIGRDISNWSPFEYLSIYIGAEIPNLDLFLIQTDGGSVSRIWGEMTFVRSITYIGGKLGLADWTYALSLPFQGMGGHSLGNVYTTFYSFAYDFGYVGVVFLTLIMAVFSQGVYQMVLGKNRRWRDIWIAIYSFLAVYLFLCFFSNKVYEEVISLLFLRSLIFLLVARFIYLRFPVIGPWRQWEVREERCVNKTYGQWYHFDIGGFWNMVRMNKRIKKMLLKGLIISAMCALAFGIVGFVSAGSAGNQTYTAAESLSVVANAGANDSQTTIASLGGTAANDLTEYMKTSEFRSTAIKNAGISSTDASKYTVSLEHATSTRVITVKVSGPEKEPVEDLLDSTVSLARTSGAESFNIASLNEVSSGSHQATADAKAGAQSPMKNAILFAFAGLLIGVLFTVAWRAFDPRITSKSDAEKTTGYNVVGFS